MDACVGRRSFEGSSTRRWIPFFLEASTDDFGGCLSGTASEETLGFDMNWPIETRKGISRTGRQCWVGERGEWWRGQVGVGWEKGVSGGCLSGTASEETLGFDGNWAVETRKGISGTGGRGLGGRKG